ncbi:MAG TPA: FtsW/RodA/SpoVE family cell cycle protein [Elusimicrobiales bacterium]|nr:FtsW/RodA/SpoVE family cell cycle protein [Elusimicrobiales bacterium]
MLNSSRGLKKSKLDFILMGVTVMLLCIGTIAIMSAVSDASFGPRAVRTHFIAIPIAAVIFFLSWSFNYQIYKDQWKILYGIIIIILVAVLIFGVSDRGAKSWFRLPLFSIQPIEICRIALILVLAGFLEKNYNRIKRVSVMLGVLLIVMPIFLLIMKQPDFSSLIVIFPTVVVMIYCAGANIAHLFVIIGYGFIVMLFPIVWTFLKLHPHWMANSIIFQNISSLSSFGMESVVFCILILICAYLLWWFFNKFRIFIPKAYFFGAALVIIAGFASGMWAYSQMKGYQHKRLEVFVKPGSDPKGASYNLLQAQIAMGSGGIVGKGVFSGTQSRLGFVPEKHTDFIMAVIGEEMGFLGSLAVLVLYVIFLWRILKASLYARDKFGYFVCCGIFTMFAIHMFINLGMSLAIVPIAGLPLPLVSYGGSNLVASLWAIGLVQSIYARRMAIV